MEYERQSRMDRAGPELDLSNIYKIGSAVGNQPARNGLNDQKVVCRLLSSIAPVDGGPAQSLQQPPGDGKADYRLVNAILNFQKVAASRGLLPGNFCDGRVDPGGKTLGLLNRFAAIGGPSKGFAPAPPPPPKNDLSFLTELLLKMAPRPTNLKIAGLGTVSMSAGPFGASAGQIPVADTTPPTRPPVSLKMAGIGLSIGLDKAGIEGQTEGFPSWGSQIHAGPRTHSTKLRIEDLLGLCVICGVSGGVKYGANITTVLFNVASNRSLRTLPADTFTLMCGGPNGFLIDAFNTCKAFGSGAGIFAGMSNGVSLIQGVIIDSYDRVRPTPYIKPPFVM